MDLATAARLKRMMGHKDDFIKRLTAERRSEYTTRVQEHQEIMKAEKARRLAARAAVRIEERRDDVIFQLIKNQLQI